jgi:hypothetical protein
MSANPTALPVLARGLDEESFSKKRMVGAEWHVARMHPVHSSQNRVGREKKEMAKE